MTYRTIEKIIEEHLSTHRTFFPTNKGQYNVLATIYTNNFIEGQYQNSYLKTHPLQKEYANYVNMPNKIYLHAEIGAIIKAKGRGDTIIITRINNSHESCPSKPCLICMKGISMTGIKQIIYVNNNLTPEILCV